VNGGVRQVQLHNSNSNVMGGNGQDNSGPGHIHNREVLQHPPAPFLPLSPEQNINPQGQETIRCDVGLFVLLMPAPRHGSR
jgi:hypothetical protein